MGKKSFTLLMSITSIKNSCKKFVIGSLMIIENFSDSMREHVNEKKKKERENLGIKS